MKSKLSGICSLEVQMALPENVCIPKSAMQSMNKLRRNLCSISKKRQGEDYSKIKNILDTLEAVAKTNGKITKIIQKSNNLLLFVRFSKHKEAKEFMDSFSSKVQLTGFGLKFATEFDSQLKVPHSPDLYQMCKILELCDKGFYDIIKANGGIITQCYIGNEYHIFSWVCFSKMKNLKAFLLSMKDNTD